MDTQLMFMAITVVLVVMHARTGNWLVGLAIGAVVVVLETLPGLLSLAAEWNGDSAAPGHSMQWTVLGIAAGLFVLRRWWGGRR